MKKVFGIKLGGLQQKIVNLVLIFMLAIVAVFAAVSVYQSKNLAKVVSDANEGQKKSIAEVSDKTIRDVIDRSMVQNTALEAYIANDLFSEVSGHVDALKGIAEKLFADDSNYGTYSSDKPRASDEGRAAVQLLTEEGVDPARSQLLGVIAKMSDAMESVYTASGRLNSCFVAAADGNCLIVDDRSGQKYNDSGEIKTVAIRQRPWYLMAAEKGKTGFTGVEADAFTGKPGVVCAAPVYRDGKLVAVVGADLFLDSIAENVNASMQDDGFVCVLNERGQVIFSPKQEGLLKAETSDKSAELTKSDYTELSEFLNSAYKETTKVTMLTIDGRECYAAGAPISAIGWTLITVVDKEATQASTRSMLEQYDRINDEAQKKFEDGSANSKTTTMVMMILLLLLALGGSLFVAGRIVRPVEHMTTRIGEISGNDLEFSMEEVYKTNDEIEVLAEAFEILSKRTRKYITEITEITREKERIGTELELAQKIQANMLPNIFPAFPDRPEFDIYAAMIPAKEVGGDFYDFFLLDEDHLGLVIADVSGKGVPAALFMMMSKILLSNYAAVCAKPSQVLELTNDAVCRNNEEEMFVTVWIGILELSTGKVTASNAGHEYPMICRDGKFELLKDKHGFVIGGMEGVKYKDYEFTLKKGDTLFLYTDGVAEASDSSDRLFGTERMLEVLNAEPEARPHQILGNMKKAVDEFVGKASQFDDLTMLAVKLLK